MNGEWIGWASSFVLFLTISTQIRKQWKERTSRGVSRWLYIGQIASEVGFVVYSWMVGNWVFVACNVFLLAANLVGIGITLKQRREDRLRGAGSGQAA